MTTRIYIYSFIYTYVHIYIYTYIIHIYMKAHRFYTSHLRFIVGSCCRLSTSGYHGPTLEGDQHIPPSGKSRQNHPQQKSADWYGNMLVVSGGYKKIRYSREWKQNKRWYSFCWRFLRCRWMNHQRSRRNFLFRMTSDSPSTGPV